MRILLSCQQSAHRYPIPSYQFWRGHFRQGLIEAGHEVLEVDGVDWALGLVPQDEKQRAAWRTAAWEKTVAHVRRECTAGSLDLFLGYLYPQQIDTTAVTAIRQAGVPTVNFFCDNVREFRTLPPEFGAFDLHWVPEFKALELYKRKGWKYVHAPMPCWVPPARRSPPPDERAVVSFIGGRDPLRAELLAAAAQAQLPLEIRGAGWADDKTIALATPPPSAAARLRDWQTFIARQGPLAAVRRASGRFAARPKPFDFSSYVRPSPNDDEYPEIVASAAVSLGINRYPSFRRGAKRPDTYSRLRDIEAPMLGACYLTEWTEGLDELYDLEREIATYRTAEELVEKSRALLGQPARRQLMRTAAQQRALNEHTVGRTLARIAAALGLATASASATPR